MHSGEFEKQKVGKICGECKQIFDPSIAFCPQDGTKLTEELVTASSHQEILQVTGTQPKIETDKPQAKGQTPAKKPETSQNSGRSQRAPEAPSDLAGSVEKLVGKVIDNHYEVLSIIGKGGMSIVYQAKDLRLNKIVAIKTLLPHLVLHPLSNQRFHQEAKAASNISHQNVVTIYDFGSTQEGQPYLVMDFLEGISWSTIIQTNGKVPMARALHVFNQVADALATAHEKGVIHRDLKPSNILIVSHETDPDHVKLVDFGIAKLLPQEGVDSVSLTQTGEVFGSPLYMSPEQAKGEKLDARADIYSMGCLMFETLTGKPPYPGENTLEVLYKHINDAIPSFKETGTRVPEKLEAIVLRCLAKDPMQRYQSMRSLQEDLLKFQYVLKGSLLHKLKSRWQIFWLRRKPRTVKEKVIFATAVLGLLGTIGLSACIANLYLAACTSPMAKQEMTWQENMVRRETKLPSPEEGAVADLAVRMAENYPKTGIETKTDAIKKLMARASDFGRKNEWGLAAKLYRHAVGLSIELNGKSSYPTLDATAKLADAYYNDNNWNEAAEQYRNLLLFKDEAYLNKLSSIFDHSEYRLGNICYFQGQYKPAFDYYSKACNSWTDQKDWHDYGDAINHLMKDNLTDETELAVCLCRMGDCLYMTAKDVPQTVAEARLRGARQMYQRATQAWNVLRGNLNYDGVVATARSVQIDRKLHNYTGLNERYLESLKQLREVLGKNHIYVGLMQADYAEFLWDTNNFIAAITNKLEAGNVFAKQKLAN